ncbi:DUF6711 family protein [Adlercreutzia sp. R25]|uniref:DUF6711 family protein n=1 Tax=Adlercreutzia shanghongiae TaxID=3111773 RepID=UPI002DBA0ADC|nr:DUF6711 family protein [Adlercreutzia sp. R25]MEC4272965.1 DUF6711 family protein [Adlercreutzia sp. R25]
MSNLLYVGPSPSDLAPVSPTPAEYAWTKQDISDPEAGRTHDPDNTMWKMQTSKKRKLNLSWKLLTADQASAVLRAFDHEYFYVRFWDAIENGYITRQFYAGDMSAPLQWFDLPSLGTRFANVSFNIIER